LELDLPDGLSVSREVGTVEDSIVVSGLSDYTLSPYTVDGTPGRRISRSVDILLKPGRYRGGVRFYGGLGSSAPLPTGHLLVNLSWASNVEDPDAHYRRSKTGNAEEPVYTAALDLFTPSGRYVGSLRWENQSNPSIGDPQTAAPNGKLYTTTTDPYPQVRRYDVSLRIE